MTLKDTKSKKHTWAKPLLDHHLPPLRLYNARQHAPPAMHLIQSFHPFPRLPVQLQLIVWKFTFHLGPLKSHDLVLIGLESSLKRALKNCDKVFNLSPRKMGRIQVGLSKL